MDHVELTLPRVPMSVARARAGLHPLRSELGARYNDAVLLVSELVTNAIRHGEGTTVQLIARIRGGSCRVEVVDAGDGFVPEPRPPDETNAGGRGLALVESIADAWGAYEGASTHVWFELDL